MLCLKVNEHCCCQNGVVAMAKAKRTKGLEIPAEVKRKVAERDSIDGHPCCIWCGKPAPTTNPLAFSCAHILRRSQGGRGIETNIVTLCWKCHQKFDESGERGKIMDFVSQYMKQHYGNDWSIEEQEYRKGE